MRLQSQHYYKYYQKNFISRTLLHISQYVLYCNVYKYKNICIYLLGINLNFVLYAFQSSSGSTSESDEWVEKEVKKQSPPLTEREDWMSMTGMLKTYTKDDIKPKREVEDKKRIDSYNPATSSRELNPYWKDGGTGVPETAENFRKQAFVKPSYQDNFYQKPSSSRDNSFSSQHRDDKKLLRHDRHSKKEFTSRDRHGDESYNRGRSQNWRRSSEISKDKEEEQPREETRHTSLDAGPSKAIKADKPIDTKYLSDEKMNKLGAKIVKAEILGDTKLVEELKAKLEAAREYRKQNPEAGKEEEGVMLIATNSAGNSMPLVKGERGDPRSKGGKRKVDTHMDGQRAKYFGNDDKYNLSQMVSMVKNWLCILMSIMNNY